MEFRNDRARDAELAARGYTVVRFTYAQVLENPEWVSQVVLRILHRH